MILLHLPAVWRIAGIAALICGLAVLIMVLRSRSTKWRLLLFCAAVMTGNGRAAVVTARTEAFDTLLPEGWQGEIYGRIAGMTLKYGVWNIELSDASLRIDEAWIPAGRIMLSCDWNNYPFRTDELKLGMTVAAYGEVRRYPVPGNPGEFDSRSYYRSLGINGKVAVSELVIRDDRYNRFRQGLYELRSHGRMILGQIAGEEESGIFKAAILGDKTELNTDIKELYQRNGIAHLLALSGLHLSLIGAAVYGGLRKAGVGFGPAGLIGAAFTCAYIVMTGSPVSVIRAGIMLSCGFLAAYMGRHYDLLSAWGLALLMLSWSQPYLLFQAGFQLSFGAIAGIGLIYPVLAGKEQGSLAQAAMIGGSVHLATLPVVLYHYYQVSLYGFFLNLLVIPLMGIVIASGISGILLARISLPLGRFAIGPGHLVLQLYELLCRLAERLPYGVWISGCPRWWQTGLYYAVLIAALRTGSGRKAGRIRLGLLIGGQLLLLVPLPVRGLQVTFLDVGQGDGVFLRTGYHMVLSDAGSSDVKDVGKYRLEPYLKHQGVSVLDYVFISHGDSDHMNGITYLLNDGKDIVIRNVILPAAGRDDPVYAKISRQAALKGSTVHWMKQGDVIENGDLTIQCLYPAADQLLRDRNAGSLVLQVSYRDFRLLLTGDIGQPEERLLLAEAETAGILADIQVLKVAHHGSRFSSSPAWISGLNPDYAVISYGADNSYGHPGSDVIERLERQPAVIYETAKNGAVTLYTDGKGIRFKTFR